MHRRHGGDPESPTFFYPFVFLIKSYLPNRQFYVRECCFLIINYDQKLILKMGQKIKSNNRSLLPRFVRITLIRISRARAYRRA